MGDFLTYYARVKCVGMDKSWFDLRPQLKRTYAQSVWIPLEIADETREGKYPNVGSWSTYEGVHSVVVPLDKRQLGDEYSWGDNHQPLPWAEPGFYKPADIYSRNREVEVGFRLILRQSVPDQLHPIWHLHQDFVIALELLKEGDLWVRPAEAYCEVARIRRGLNNAPVGIEVKAEFLRDYLCARNCALRISSYRDKSGILDELGDVDFPKQAQPQLLFGGRLEERAWPIDPTGSPFGSSVAVLHLARNDVDPTDDVPVMGPETNENVDSKRWSFRRNAGKVHRVMSEFWRDEWIEPASTSTRVRRDRVPSQVTYIVSADGSRMNSDELNNQDVGRWLWFNPGIVASLLARRGGRISWYTRDTGGLSTPSDPAVHFGINEKGLITVYAYDVASLPEWERRLWAGFNVTPDGGVSSELLSAQVRAEVAESKAPEAYFGQAIEELQNAWRTRFGSALLRPHEKSDDILAKIHRFRSSDRAGFYALAKDVARLTADSIDASVAQAVMPPKKGERFGSLKSLERALSTICGDRTAHEIIGPLFAAYDLRLSDAHLPQSDLSAAIALVGIEGDDPPLVEGYKLLDAVVGSLYRCGSILTGDFPSVTQNTSTASLRVD